MIEGNYGIEECLIPHEMHGGNGFSEVLKLQVVRENPVMYKVLYHDPDLHLDKHEGFKLVKGRRIGFRKLMDRLHDQYTTFNHLRCKTEEGGLVIVLMNDDLRV